MAVPAIVHAEHKVVREMRVMGALSPAAAQPLPELRWMQQRAAGRLLAAGALREARPGTYWLDEDAYGAYRGARRQRAGIIIIAMLIVIAGLVLLGIVKI